LFNKQKTPSVPDLLNACARLQRVRSNIFFNRVLLIFKIDFTLDNYSFYKCFLDLWALVANER